MSEKVERSDGRGILSGAFLNEDRDINRDDWIRDCFPEWGTLLNKEIEDTKVQKGTVSLWWLGGPSFAMKTADDHVFLIDSYAGPSIYTTYDYCGVCRTGGSPTLNWLRLGPQMLDIWAFKKLDAVFCSHHHQDHCDVYTIKAALKTTDAKFIGPKITTDKFRKFQVPENRISMVKPGDSIKYGKTEIQMLINYDTMAAMTGAKKAGENQKLEDVAVSFLFKTEGGNILFLADTLYSNGYAEFGQKYQIDIACMNMGYAPPGATDKMSPYDAMRVAQAVKAKVVIPYHYDNWANSQEDPAILEWLIQKKGLNMKSVILKPGARFTYPNDQNIGRYKYPDYAETYRADYSWEYGKPAKGEKCE